MAKKYEDITTTSSKLQTWKYIIKCMFKYKKTLVLMIATVILIGFLDLAIPLLNSYSIKRFFSENNPDRFEKDYLIMGIYLGMVPIYFINSFLYKFLCEKMNSHLAYELRHDAYFNLQKLSFSYFDKNASGWIMARLSSDARSLSDLISYGLLDGIMGAIQMVGIFVILLFINPILSIIFIVVCPFMFFLARKISKKQLAKQRIVKKINSEMTGLISENLIGIKATKTLVTEEINNDLFFEKAREYKRSRTSAIRLGSSMGPVMFILGYIVVAFVVIFGGKMVLEDVKILGNVLTIATLYLFVDYAIKFFDPVFTITSILNEFQNANASAERIVSLIKEEPSIMEKQEVIDKYGTIFEPITKNYEEIIGDVEFKNVSFNYLPGEPVLKNFNLKIKSGSSVGIVGHTGSGKSTIINLICRFYEPTEGNILIDGVDYRDRSLGWLHSKIGYVLQSPQLFTGTILENVKYGKLDATLDEVKRACEIVNAASFIESLPDGYNSYVGEGGGHLSMGEKQLISFARAVISDPKILVLDEATSSIDTKTEAVIKTAISKMLENRTSFLVAHRLSTVVDCDIILVFDKGEIIEKGTHNELLEQKGYYYNLYKNQFQAEQEKIIISGEKDI